VTWFLLLWACNGGSDDASTPSETTTDPTSTTDTDPTAPTGTTGTVDSSPTADTGTPPLDPLPPQAGELLIEELYYSGAEPAGGTDHYYSDQFVELENTVDWPLDVSGVLIADVYGVSGEINPGTQPDSLATELPDQVVLSTVWRIPDGTILAPGETLVIAHDGTNHRPFSTIDLSGASFEAYAADSGGDDDHPTVPNLESVVYNAGYDWLITVFGPSVVVLAPDTPLGSHDVGGFWGTMPTAPTSAVIDAVETLMDFNSGEFKRLPEDVDAGHAFVSGPYVGQSVHRKRLADGTLQDTNDSSADFSAGDPDPGQPPPSEGITGTPELELGTGWDVFTPLADGGDIELVAGIQGGWHLDVSTRFAGFGPNGVHLVYEALTTNADRVSFTTEAVLSEFSVLEDDDGWARVGDRVVLDIASAGDVVGETLIVRVTAELDGQTWSDERSWVVVDEQ